MADSKESYKQDLGVTNIVLCPRTQHNNKLTQLGLQALSPDLDSSTHTKRPLCLRQTRVIIAKYYTWMNPQNSLNLMHHSFPICIFKVLHSNEILCFSSYPCLWVTNVNRNDLKDSTSAFSRIVHSRRMASLIVEAAWNSK